MLHAVHVHFVELAVCVPARGVQIREERRRERERERRLEAKDAHGTKKSKITRDRDRDISEKVRGECGCPHADGACSTMLQCTLFTAAAALSPFKPCCLSMQRLFKPCCQGIVRFYCVLRLIPALPSPCRQVALGMVKVTGGEVMYDQRLFNQDQGMAAGFGAEDSYGVYDKALFADRSAAGALYRWAVLRAGGLVFYQSQHQVGGRRVGCRGLVLRVREGTVCGY